MLASSLVDLLRLRAEQFGQKTAFGFLEQGETLGKTLSFAELWHRVQVIGAALKARYKPGDRALLLYPPGIDFVEAFFGCLFAGVIAVPGHLPEFGNQRRHLPRLYAIAKDAEPALILTRADRLEWLRGFLMADPRTSDLPLFSLDQIVQEAPSDAEPWSAAPQHTAVILYTSGSTGDPKGAIISHANVLHNLSLISTKFGNDSESTHVNWLPLFHDLGLVVVMLGSLHCGASCYLMDPGDFIQKPSRWLRAISRFQARNAYGPNFAFELCLRKVSAEERRELDLRCWRLALNGAEPVRADTMDNFVRIFEPYGFKREAFYPAYGMAEATGLIAGGTPETAPIVRCFEEQALGDFAVKAASSGPGARSLVACGSGGAGLEIAIVDPETMKRSAPAQTGEIWLRGESISHGYWRRLETSQAIFGAVLFGEEGTPYLRTGDLGFFHEGNIYLTGRLKDLIIIRGKNHYPQDIEQCVERSHPALRPGGCVAFSLDFGSEERVGIVAEVLREEEPDDVNLPGEILRAIRTGVTQDHEILIGRIALLPPRGLQKTTSGKLRRRATRAALLAGELPVWAQWEAQKRVDGPPGPENGTEEATSLLELVRSEVAAALDLFDAAEIPLDQPLMDLGLDSLTVVELRNRIQALTGLRLEITLIWRFPHLPDLVFELHRRLARTTAALAIGEKESTQAALCAVRIRVGTAPGSVVLLPGWRGGLKGMARLARSLKVKQPVFGLTPHPLAEAGIMPQTLTMLCQRYVQELLPMLPAGPLLLIGHSFGGSAALELAVLLQAEGVAIDRVVMLDAVAPRALPAEQPFNRIAALEELLGRFGLRLDANTTQSLSDGEAFAQAVAVMEAADLSRVEPASLLKTWLGSMEASGTMLSAWTPRGPRAPVHLLRAMEREPDDTAQEDLGWNSYLVLDSIENIPGDHSTILVPPHLETTALTIARCSASS